VNNEFRFDKSAFRRAVEHQVNDGMREIGARAQGELDTIFQSFGGQPVEAIAPQLKAAFRRLGWEVTPEQVRSYAEAVAAGTRVVIKVGDVGL
jgi:hypothetical protein